MDLSEIPTNPTGTFARPVVRSGHSSGPPTLPSTPSSHADPITPADSRRCFRWLLPCGPLVFPEMQAGRPPQLHFRGLLGIHSRSACEFVRTPYVSIVPGYLNRLITQPDPPGYFRGKPTTPLTGLSPAGMNNLLVAYCIIRVKKLKSFYFHTF